MKTIIKQKTAWKVLKKGMRSEHGHITWKKGVWNNHKGDLKLCDSGFHASKLLVDAIKYVIPGIICKVEYKGEVLEDDDKLVCNNMRVVETYRLTKKMAVEFSIYCAKIFLNKFEKEFPNDNRPRLAIEAAENYLKNPCKKTKSAAGAAARAAARAADAARAAWAAGAAAWTARAAWAAWATGAARAAGAAARAAGITRAAEKNKMEKELLRIIGDKK